ncbi:MAG TPA: formate--tetrahydrofolate ligase [Acidisarcina sp.]|nr:formate--tetrahydrofolate ligase [Acidisarcina sp.]
MSKPLLPICEVARKLALPEKYFETIGNYGAKVKLEFLNDRSFPVRGKLVLVTATTPTVSGEGKTVVAIGLTQGLTFLGKSAILTSREPSLGPVFGLKGGAAGGGLSQVEPSQKINLHFHGDFHAVTSAHNLLAAMIDSHMFHGNALDLDPEQITWPRTLDMNDRALRNITVTLGGKAGAESRKTGFVIAAASEVMAIMALASGREDLRHRLGSIIVGVSRSGRAISADDLGATGAMMALLDEALMPNLVQTTEGAPAFVHMGPFGNIAHGTSSVLSQQAGLRLADYVINEAGFGADLGAEKYLDIVMRSSGIRPAAAVVVTTVQSMRNMGGGDLLKGLPNLERHLENLKRYGLSLVVAINRFPHDTDEDLKLLREYCCSRGVKSALAEAFTKGGEGCADLAAKVVELLDANPDPQIQPLYALTDSLEEKVLQVARKIYGASDVAFSEAAKAQLRRLSDWGYSNLPVCIAKTQYSFTDDPKIMGAPSGWTFNVRDVALSAGAGFVVVIAGNMMLMPGLPKVPRALAINVDTEGCISGI